MGIVIGMKLRLGMKLGRGMSMGIDICGLIAVRECRLGIEVELEIMIIKIKLY